MIEQVENCCERIAVKEDLNILRESLRELITGTIDKAGKGKSEFVKILGREIGQALAAVLKEPLDQLVRTRKINVCIELVEREGSPEAPKQSEPKPHLKNASSTNL